LPKKPGDVELRVIKEMFEASVDGQPYDTDRWGQYFRPAGVTAPSSSGVSSSDVDAAEESFKSAPKMVAQAAPVTKSVSVDEDSPFDTDDTPAASAPVQAAKPAGSAQDILAMIRSRQNKQ
jgi:hypothetical protein